MAKLILLFLPTLCLSLPAWKEEIDYRLEIETPRRRIFQEDNFRQDDGQEILDLTVVHINDFHAHFDQTSVYTSRCREEEDEACYGGVARVYQRQSEIRQIDPDALFFNAGDFYQGTAWYTKLRYGPMVEFGNIMNYTAMGVGNHDFDDGVAGFVPFAEQVNYPLLGANIVSTDPNFQQGIHFNKSMVTSVRGVQVGIIGYVTTSTSYNFPLHEVKFTNEIEAVQEEATALKNAGINVIIALGHSGYDIDKELAEMVPELDLVVGGHSHTFLYTPTEASPNPPSIEYPRGDYPTFVTQPGGKVVPVVQVYCYTKYLGHLRLRFDSNGDLLTPVKSKGVIFAEPELLSGYKVQQSSMVLDAMEKWKANLTEFQQTIGHNEVLLEEFGPGKESNLGDVVCDSYAAAHEDTRIAFANNGGIRSNLEVGDILYDDILYILPFDNTVDLVTMRGSGIKNVLEKMCQYLDPEDIFAYPGFGYQVAGLNFEVLVTNDNRGSRIMNLRVKENDGSYIEIDENKIYNVALPEFLAPHQQHTKKTKPRQEKSKGIFDDDVLTHVVGTTKIYEAMKDWILNNSPIHQEVEGRFYITAQ